MNDLVWIVLNIAYLIAFICFMHCEKENTKAHKEQTKELRIQNKSTSTCNHELRELNYYYETDYWTKGSLAFDNEGNGKTFHYCKKCGQVFVKKRNKNLEY